MQTRSNVGELIKIHPGRLFAGSCFSLIATAVAFAMMGHIADSRINEKLDAVQTIACLRLVVDTLPALEAAQGKTGDDIAHAAELARKLSANMKPTTSS